MNKAISQFQRTSSHAETQTEHQQKQQMAMQIRNIIKVFVLKLH